MVNVYCAINTVLGSMINSAYVVVTLLKNYAINNALHMIMNLQIVRNSMTWLESNKFSNLSDGLLGFTIQKLRVDILIYYACQVPNSSNSLSGN